MAAVIYVGSHTVRLLIAQEIDGELVTRHYDHVVTHLGTGVSQSRQLSEAAMAQTLAALEHFAHILHRFDETKVRIVGTEALRVATNRDDFICQLKRRTGLHLEVLSGEREAVYMANGVLQALQPQPDKAVIFDVGGASTEVVCVSHAQLCFHASYPIGVVTLRDHLEPERLVADFTQQLVLELTQAGLWPQVTQRDWAVVGTAGTVTTLAATQQQMAVYCPDKITNFKLKRTELAALADKLKGLSGVEREKLPGIESGRGETIVFGIELVCCLLDSLKCSVMTVSDAGLMQGVFYTEYSRHAVLSPAD